MLGKMEENIKKIIKDEMKKLGRGDLFREPIVGFSSVDDNRYEDLKEIIGDWLQSPSEILPASKSVISYFIPFTKEVVEGPRSVDRVSPQWSESYVVINEYFNHINGEIKKYLLAEGFTAKDMAATHTYDPKVLKSTWSHRSAAAIAGIGAFGLNRMLITERGCGGRYGSVITSAPLEGNDRPVENTCLYMQDESCSLCVDVCPADALSMDGDFDKFACHDLLLENMEIMKEMDIVASDTCGKCISVCPVAYME